MLLCHSADWHLDESRGMLDRQAAALHQMIDSCGNAGVDLFLFCGDYSGFDAPHHQTTKELLTFIKIIQHAAEIAPVAMIPGNHDEPEQISIVNKIKSKNPIYYSNIFYAMEVPTESGPINLHFAPWFGKGVFLSEIGKTNIELENAEASRLLVNSIDNIRGYIESRFLPRVLLAHYPVPGGRMGTIEVSSKHEVVLDVDEIKNNFDYIALGHLHCRQSAAPNVYYSGSPVPLDFGEEQPKGFNLVEISEGITKVSFEKISSWNNITLDVTIKDNGSLESVDSTPCIFGNRIRVEMPDGHRDRHQMELFKQRLELMGALSVTYRKKPKQRKKNENGDNSDARSAKSILELFKNKLGAVVPREEDATRILRLFEEYGVF